MRIARGTVEALIACSLLGLGLGAGCLPGDEAEVQETDAGSSGDVDPATTAVTTTSTNGGPGYDQTLACSSWLACLPDEEAAAFNDEYGPEGSCWSGGASMVEACDSICADSYAADCTSDPSAGSGTTSDPPEPEFDECSLEHLAPNAESLVEAGDEAAVIPTEIGSIIDDFCSCHVATLESFDRLTPLYYGNIRFTTFAEMHANFEGAPAYVEFGNRAVDELNMPPVYYCGDAEFGSIHSPEYEILDAWITAEAPDGETWLAERPDDLPTREE